MRYLKKIETFIVTSKLVEKFVFSLGLVVALPFGSILSILCVEEMLGANRASDWGFGVALALTYLCWVATIKIVVYFVPKAGEWEKKLFPIFIGMAYVPFAFLMHKQGAFAWGWLTVVLAFLLGAAMAKLRQIALSWDSDKGN